LGELRPSELSLDELLAKEHPFEVWVTDFDALKATESGILVSAVGTPESWEDVEPPTLASLSRAYDTFKMPKKIKLGGMLSPSHIPLTPRSDRLPLTMLDTLEDSMGEDEQSRLMDHALHTVLADWYKLNANFELIQLELQSNSRGETRYRNTVNTTVEEMLGAVNNMTRWIQILAASIGTGSDDADAGPMSLWEAIEDLRAATRRTDAVSDGNYAYLDDLRKSLPNWSKNLGDLSKNYIINLPKMNTGLVGCRQHLDILEGSPPNGFPSMLNGTGGTGGQSYVDKTDFDASKREVERTLVELHSSLAGIDSSSLSTDPRIEKVLERLGELEGRVTGEAFSMGSYVFCSHTEVAEWIVSEKVPTAGVFWDLFSTLVCMKPK
jgi:hypothetical protein